jgi:hypothetical protein
MTEPYPPDVVPVVSNVPMPRYPSVANAPFANSIKSIPD